MQTRHRLGSLLITAALAMAAVTTVFAADPALGTWQLNLAKSSFSPGPPPKAQTRIYTESAQGITLTVNSTAADGKESTTTLTFKGDGTPVPVSGNPNFDTVSVKSISARSVKATQMRAGVTVGTAVRTVSKDGKTLTYKASGTDAKGAKYSSVEVYDRQ